MATENDYKKKDKFSRSISVHKPVDNFFQWMLKTNRNRSELIEESILKHPLYKQYLKEKKDG